MIDNIKKSNKYKGYTYPKILQNNFIFSIWKNFFCVKGWHLWDEVLSIQDHYLHCDACEQTIDIK